MSLSLICRTTFLFCLVCAVAGCGNADDGKEVAELKARIDALEQQIEDVAEVEAEPTPQPISPDVTTAPSALTRKASSLDGSMEKYEMNELKRDVERLENQQRMDAAERGFEESQEAFCKTRRSLGIECP